MTIEIYLVCGVISCVLMVAIRLWRKSRGIKLDHVCLEEWVVFLLAVLFLWPCMWVVVGIILGICWYFERKDGEA